MNSSQTDQGNSKQAQKLKEMLATPTTNFGLAALFKNFVLIDYDYQIEEVTWSLTRVVQQAGVAVHCWTRAQQRKPKPKVSQTRECRVFNQYLLLVKHLAFDCPIAHIADVFYRLLNEYIVSKWLLDCVIKCSPNLGRQSLHCPGHRRPHFNFLRHFRMPLRH